MFVTKADQVPDMIDRELERHRAGSRLLTVKPMGEHGLWSMEAGEAEAVARFLAARHSERLGPPAVSSNRAPANRLQIANPDSDPARAKPAVEAVCKHCGSKHLSARSGKYGYHWRCGTCGKNTKIPVQCSACGAQRQRDNAITKIRKEGTTYFRDCKACGTSEVVWSEAETSAVPRHAGASIG